MKRKNIGFQALWLLLLIPLLVFAHSTQDKTMSMNSMMKDCQKYCKETVSSIDKMTTNMEIAQKSNDPAKMRLALAEAIKPLSVMKQNTKNCLNMMSMMQNMNGMGGMQNKSGTK